MRFVAAAVGYFVMVVATAIATMALIDLMQGNVDAVLLVGGVWLAFTVLSVVGYQLLRAGSRLAAPSDLDPSTYLLITGIAGIILISNLVLLGLSLMGLFSTAAPTSTSWGLLVFATA